jgi:hypothetical protein
MYYSFFRKFLGAEVSGFMSSSFNFFHITSLTNRFPVSYCMKFFVEINCTISIFNINNLVLKIMFLDNVRFLIGITIHKKPHS